MHPSPISPRMRLHDVLLSDDDYDDYGDPDTVHNDDDPHQYPAAATKMTVIPTPAE